ncbi:hypothetical protein BJ508DRAFT_323031 [Ascobolus immersus RN42]|uniref:Uncharacterized protein n=1 Tax=Ascobolus immersus RN42 TaxID=1160509 RepID=A0A3N4IKJ0_ASCIM|nr:hypothetical protein BJ508DRAFT_323031 [Ascobolus immersus RN42]
MVHRTGLKWLAEGLPKRRALSFSEIDAMDELLGHFVVSCGETVDKEAIKQSLEISEDELDNRLRPVNSDKSNQLSPSLLWVDLVANWFRERDAIPGEFDAIGFTGMLRALRVLQSTAAPPVNAAGWDSAIHRAYEVMFEVLERTSKGPHSPSDIVLTDLATVQKLCPESRSKDDTDDSNHENNNGALNKSSGTCVGSGSTQSANPEGYWTWESLSHYLQLYGEIGVYFYEALEATDNWDREDEEWILPLFRTELYTSDNGLFLSRMLYYTRVAAKLTFYFFKDSKGALSSLESILQTQIELARRRIVRDELNGVQIPAEDDAVLEIQADIANIKAAKMLLSRDFRVATDHWQDVLFRKVVKWRVKRQGQAAQLNLPSAWSLTSQTQGRRHIFRSDDVSRICDALLQLANHHRKQHWFHSALIFCEHAIKLQTIDDTEDITDHQTPSADHYYLFQNRYPAVIRKLKILVYDMWDHSSDTLNHTRHIINCLHAEWKSAEAEGYEMQRRRGHSDYDFKKSGYEYMAELSALKAKILSLQIMDISNSEGCELQWNAGEYCAREQVRRIAVKTHEAHNAFKFSRWYHEQSHSSQPSSAFCKYCVNRELDSKLPEAVHKVAGLQAVLDTVTKQLHDPDEAARKCREDIERYEFLQNEYDDNSTGTIFRRGFEYLCWNSLSQNKFSEALRAIERALTWEGFTRFPSDIPDENDAERINKMRPAAQNRVARRTFLLGYCNGKVGENGKAYRLVRWAKERMELLLEVEVLRRCFWYQECKRYLTESDPAENQPLAQEECLGMRWVYVPDESGGNGQKMTYGSGSFRVLAGEEPDEYRDTSSLGDYDWDTHMKWYNSEEASLYFPAGEHRKVYHGMREEADMPDWLFRL